MSIGSLLNRAYGSKRLGAGLDKIHEYCRGKVAVAMKYIQPDDSILDLGCGNPKDNFTTGFFLEKYRNYTGVDLEPPRRDNRFIKSDLRSFDTTKKYDVVLCLDALEHFHQPLEIANRIKRFARRNVIVSTPTIFHNSFRAFLNIARRVFGLELMSGHYWEFFEEEILQMFKDMKLEEIRYFDAPIVLIYPLLSKLKMIKCAVYAFAK
nr:methyltransferase domain-containing protein [Candidatus Njordarchaeota archaeon]